MRALAPVHADGVPVEASADAAVVAVAATNLQVAQGRGSKVRAGATAI